MAEGPHVYLDTSVVFAAVHSELGGSRTVLKLGEAGLITLWVGPWVLREAERVLDRKSRKSKADLALLLHRCRVRVGLEAGPQHLERALVATGHLPDAQIVAEALAAGADYLVILDRAHLVGRPGMTHLPFPVGTPGELLAWYRARITQGAG